MTVLTSTIFNLVSLSSSSSFFFHFFLFDRYCFEPTHHSNCFIFISYWDNILGNKREWCCDHFINIRDKVKRVTHKKITNKKTRNNDKYLNVYTSYKGRARGTYTNTDTFRRNHLESIISLIVAKLVLLPIVQHTPWIFYYFNFQTCDCLSFVCFILFEMWFAK